MGCIHRLGSCLPGPREAFGQVLAWRGVLQIRRVLAIRYPAAAARTRDPAGFAAEICRKAMTGP
jgi:hypothetical protein